MICQKHIKKRVSALFFVMRRNTQRLSEPGGVAREDDI